MLQKMLYFNVFGFNRPTNGFHLNNVHPAGFVQN